MTLDILRLRAPWRKPAEPAPVGPDQSLPSVLWLLLFLVFAPIIGAHVVFTLFAEPIHAQTRQSQHANPGEHG